MSTPMHRLILSALALFGALSCSEPDALAHPPSAHRPPPVDVPVAPHALPEVSVQVQTAHGAELPTYWQGQSLYVAGQVGQRYSIRLTNNTGERVEAVVTVDGRDVVSGEVGNFKTQRGYVMDPWGHVVIDGFRRSLDQVAAFRFSDPGQSYSARRGTPQHVGVIGVAVFKERRRARPRPRPAPIYAPDPQPTRPHVYTRPTPDPYPAARHGGGRSKSAAPQGAAAEDASMGEAEAAPSRRRAKRDSSVADYGSGSGARGSAGGRGRSYAPAPPRQNELGTRYGETRTSRVREVEFKRRNRRRPDTVLTVYYDSWDGLVARGVIDPLPTPYVAPQPFPRNDARFAPPPPGDYRR